MDLVRTSMTLSKTIKNVPRLKEILSVFAKNGFEEFILQARLTNLIPNFILPKSSKDKIAFKKENLESSWHSLGQRLRVSFEELGPSFIKVGQLLSTREDLLHPLVIFELKKLQNKVQEVDFLEIKTIIEENLGDSIDNIFSSFNPKPIGVASIGLAYKAILRENNQVVVVKVRRPGIKKVINSDFEIIAFVVHQLEKISDEIQSLGLSRAIEDFFTSIQGELNFYIEASNCTRLKSNIGKLDADNDLYIPEIYERFSSAEIIVMEYLDGIPFNEIKDLNNYPGLEEKLLKAVKMFAYTILADGFFHADLHGGNFFLLKENKIGLIDFGLVGNLSKKSRSNLIAILHALVTRNFENLVYEFLDVAEYESVPDETSLVKDLQNNIAPMLMLDLQKIDVNFLFVTIISTLSKHKIYLPREWFIIFRALITLDGVGKSLKINFNLFELINSEVPELIKTIINPKAIMEDSLWITRDAISSLRIIPRHIRWALKEISKKQYSFDLNLHGVQESFKNVSDGLFFSGFIFMSSTLLISGVLILGSSKFVSLNEIPILVLILWSLSLFFLIFALQIYLRKRF